MSHRITFVCEECDTNYMLGPEQQLPPYWIAARLIMSDGEGIVPSVEQEEIYAHFCSLSCLHRHMKSNKIKKRHEMIDREMEQEKNESNDESGEQS